MGWSNIGNWSNTPSWSNAAPTWGNSGKTNPWSNVSPGVSWGNVPWSNVSPGVSWGNVPWSNVSPGISWGNAGASQPVKTPVPVTPTTPVGTPSLPIGSTPIAPIAPSAPITTSLPGGGKATISTDLSGTTLLTEDYSKQGGGIYTTPIAGFKGGWSGSGFQEAGAEALASSAGMAAIAAAPKSTQVQVLKDLGYTPQEIAKIQFLQSPTAQWGSQTEFEQAISGVRSPFGFEPKGQILTSTPEQRLAEKQFYEKTGKTFLETTPSVPSIEEQTKFEAYPKFTSFIYGKELLLTPEMQLKMQEKKVQTEAEKWWSGLSDLEKKEALITAGTIDIRVAGSYLGKTFFGTEESDLGWKADIYKTLNIEGARTQTPIERTKEAVFKVGTGTTAQAAAMMLGVGAGMKVITGGAKALGLSEAAIATGEKALGLGFGAVIAKGIGETAISGKPGTALAEVGLLGVTLPMAGIGSKAVSEIGRFTPTPKEFFRFTAGKAEPIITKIEPVTKFIETKEPDFIKNLREPVVEKITREPSAIKLMTPSVRTIYESEKLTPQAKEMIESGVRLEYLLKEAPPEQIVPIEFVGAKAPKYGERIGEAVKTRLEKNPQDVLGGSTSVGAFVPEFRKGADWDYYAKNYKETVNYFFKEAKKVYPDATLEEKHGMTTIKAEKHSVIDIHKLSEYTPVGERIISGTGKEIPGMKGIETLGVGRKPLRIEKVEYMDPVEQLTRKLQGTTKYIARKTVEKPRYTLTGREKDAPDFIKIAESLGRAETKVSPEKSARIAKELTKFKKAEETKFYAGIPADEYGKLYYETVKGKVPSPILFVKPSEKKPVEQTGYDKIFGEKKLLTEYYPSTPSKQATKLVEGYYPTIKAAKPSVKKEISLVEEYYPLVAKKEESGYYPPALPKQVKYPRPMLDVFYNEGLDSEIPIDIVKFDKDSEKIVEKTKPKKHIRYTRKKRISPIFEGAEKLFETKELELGLEPKKSKKTIIKSKKSEKFWEA